MFLSQVTFGKTPSDMDAEDVRDTLDGYLVPVQKRHWALNFRPDSVKRSSKNKCLRALLTENSQTRPKQPAIFEERSNAKTRFDAKTI